MEEDFEEMGSGLFQQNSFFSSFFASLCP